MLSNQPENPHEIDYDSLFADLGEAALRDDSNDFREAACRFMEIRAQLMEEHPNKWVAMGKDGVIAVGDSIEEVVAATRAKGISTADVTIEYLDAELHPLTSRRSAGDSAFSA